MSADSPGFPGARHRRLAGLLFLLLAAAAPARAQEAVDLRARYAKREEMVPMRDGVRLFTAVYVPKDALADVPDPADPHAVQRRPVRRRPYQRYLGPSPRSSARRATSSSTRTSAAGACPRASSSTCGPHNPAKRGPQDIDESTDTYDTIDWLVKNVPNHNGKVGHVGHLVSRLLHRRRHDRRPPGAEGRLAAGAGHRLVRRRRLPPQRRVLPAARLQLHRQLRPARGPSRPRSSPRRSSTTARRTATSSSCDMGPLAERRHAVLQGRDRVLERGDGAREPTTSSGRRATSGRTCKDIKPAVMTVGGWFDAEDLFGAARRPTRRVERQSPGATEHAGHGPWSTAAGRAATATSLGDVTLRRQDRRVLPRARSSCRSSSIYLKGKGDARSCPRRWVFETGTNRLAQVRRLAAAGRRSRRRSTSTPAARLASRRPRRPTARRVRRVRQRPGEAGAVHRQDGHRHGAREYMIDRPAVRRAPARRARLPDRAARRRTSTLAGPIEVELHVSTTGTDADWVVKLIDVYPDDYPGPEPEPDRRADGRLPAARPRRRRCAASSATASRSPSRSSRASRRR